MFPKVKDSAEKGFALHLDYHTEDRAEINFPVTRKINPEPAGKKSWTASVPEMQLF